MHRRSAHGSSPAASSRPDLDCANSPTPRHQKCGPEFNSIAAPTSGIDLIDPIDAGSPGNTVNPADARAPSHDRRRMTHARRCVPVARGTRTTRLLEAKKRRHRLLRLGVFRRGENAPSRLAVKVYPSYTRQITLFVKLITNYPLTLKTSTLHSSGLHKKVTKFPATVFTEKSIYRSNNPIFPAFFEISGDIVS
jgi:hypothetical protein